MKSTERKWKFPEIYWILLQTFQLYISRPLSCHFALHLKMFQPFNGFSLTLCHVLELKKNFSLIDISQQKKLFWLVCIKKLFFPFKTIRQECHEKKVLFFASLAVGSLWLHSKVSQKTFSIHFSILWNFFTSYCCALCDLWFWFADHIKDLPPHRFGRGNESVKSSQGKSHVMSESCKGCAEL